MGHHLLYLVRHGQYITDGQHKKSGALTALGRKQAQRTAKRLAELPVTTLYHSDIPRAVETATIIRKALTSVPVHSTRLLREMSLPIPAELRHLYRTKSSDISESLAQGQALFERFFVPTRAKEDRIDVLVAHGNLIRYLTRIAMDDKVGTWMRLGTSNCGITIFSIGKTRKHRYLIRFNDVGHLPQSMQTET